MATDSWEIRLVSPEDNRVLSEVLRTVLHEMAVPYEGTALSDPELDNIYDAYRDHHADYWVVTHEQQVMGGAGIAPLRNGPEKYCELQKMYFLPQARGQGLGHQMMRKCLQQAKQFGFTTRYLETMPNMRDAQRLYQQWGFEYIDGPLGNTGHSSCPVWMIKSLCDDF